MTTIAERLTDPNERFSSADLYEAFEALGSQYGWHRDPNLPKPGMPVQTASMTVPKFEHLGVLIVRPRTGRDTLITLPNLVDKLLGDNFVPSQKASFNVNLIALASTVIIAPVGIVEQILNSDDDTELKFFLAFAEEYSKWMQARAEEAKAKKFGRTTGNEPASPSDTLTDSPPLTTAG
jgi:hypothetical protein